MAQPPFAHDDRHDPEPAARTSGDRPWRERAARWFPASDLLHLSPPGVARALFRLATEPNREDEGDEGLDAFDPEFARFCCDTLRTVGERWFRWRVQGIENVPAEGPVLLVGSHNGGMMVTDSGLTLVAIYDHFGYERVVHPLAHDILHHHPALRPHAARLGVLRARRGGAEKALARGRIVLVYPGSDLDSTRPFWHRHRAELGGRKGFARLALRTGATVVPVASVGTHEQWIVLWRGERLARWLGASRWLRIHAFPIVLSVPWGITHGYLPYVPLPAQTTLGFGAPLRWPDLGPSDADDEAAVDRVYADVHAGIQRELDSLSKGRLPWIGRPDFA